MPGTASALGAAGAPGPRSRRPGAARPRPRRRRGSFARASPPGRDPRRRRRRRRGRPSPWSIDLDRHAIVAVAHGDLGGRRARVLERVGERLLHQPVGGHVCAGAELDRVALRRRSVAGRPGEPRSSDQRLDLVEARRAVERLDFAAPHGAEQATQLDQRLAAGSLDQLRGVDRRMRDLRASTRRAPDAWTTMTLRLWASTSWMSRAMRARSTRPRWLPPARAGAGPSPPARRVRGRAPSGCGSIRPIAHGATPKTKKGKTMSSGVSMMQIDEDRRPRSSRARPWRRRHSAWTPAE